MAEQSLTQDSKRPVVELVSSLRDAANEITVPEK